MEISKQEENRNFSGHIVGVAEYRASIFPSPDELERYEALHSGTAKMLFNTYEMQVNHRVKTEAEESKRTSVAQIFAFSLTLLTIIGGFILILADKDVYGIVAILGATATLLSALWGSLLKKS